MGYVKRESVAKGATWSKTSKMNILQYAGLSTQKHAYFIEPSCSFIPQGYRRKQSQVLYLNQETLYLESCLAHNRLIFYVLVKDLLQECKTQAELRHSKIIYYMYIFLNFRQSVLELPHLASH